MVFRQNRRPSGHPGQRTQRRLAVVERLRGTGLVQVHRELVAEREQLRFIRYRPEETVGQRSDRGNVR